MNYGSLHFKFVTKIITTNMLKNLVVSINEIMYIKIDETKESFSIMGE